MANAVFAKHQHVSIVTVSLLASPLSSASTVSMAVILHVPTNFGVYVVKYERNKGRNSKLSRPAALTLHRLRKTKLFFCHRLKKVFSPSHSHPRFTFIKHTVLHPMHPLPFWGAHVEWKHWTSLKLQTWADYCRGWWETHACQLELGYDHY